MLDLFNTIRVSNNLDPDQARHFVQTVCKGYQQTTKVDSSGQRVKYKTTCWYYFLAKNLAKVDFIWLQLKCWLQQILSQGKPWFNIIRHNFLSTQYLEHKLIVSPNFVFALILTRCGLGLLHIIFHLFLPSGGSRGGSRGLLEPPLRQIHFIFMGKLRKKEVKSANQTHVKSEPPFQKSWSRSWYQKYGLFLHHNAISTQYLSHDMRRECSGSVVECLTRERRAAVSSLTGVTALWSLSKTHLS